MDTSAPVAFVILLLLAEYFYFTWAVGQARMKHQVKPPTMTGPPEFERTVRVQANTLEQLVIVLPALWLFGDFVSHIGAAVLGLIFFVGRWLYFVGYVRSADDRMRGFLIGFLTIVVLIVGGLAGVLWSFL